MELLHEGYHDGWVIEGMKKELKKLKKSLTSIVKQLYINQLGDYEMPRVPKNWDDERYQRRRDKKRKKRKQRKENLKRKRKK